MITPERAALHALVDQLPDELVSFAIDLLTAVVNGVSWSVAEEDAFVRLAEKLGNGDIEAGTIIYASRYPALLR